MNVDVRVPEAANVVAVGVAVVNVAEAAAEVGTEIVVVVVAEIGIETEIEIGIEIGIGIETVVGTVVAAVKRTPHEKKQPALGVARAKPTKVVVEVVGVGVVVMVAGPPTMLATTTNCRRRCRTGMLDEPTR